MSRRGVEWMVVAGVLLLVAVGGGIAAAQATGLWWVGLAVALIPGVAAVLALLSVHYYRPRPSARWSPSARWREWADYDYLVRKALAEQHPGRLLFNPPEQMRLGETERVEVRVTRTLGLDADLLEHLHGHGSPQMEAIPTAPLMAVSLRGDGFRITPYSDEEQGVTRDEITTWEFDIRAEKPGRQRLVLSVSLRVPIQDWPSQRRSIPVREVTVDVQVGTAARVGRFVSANWQWFVGTAIAIAAVIIALVH